MFARNRVSPPFSRVFVAKSRRRRQSYGAFLARIKRGRRPEGTGGAPSRSPTKRNAALADGSGAVADNS